jgi:hypothetical protein
MVKPQWHQMKCISYTYELFYISALFAMKFMKVK